MTESNVKADKRCETCKYNSGIGYCVELRDRGFPVEGVCDQWQTNWVATDKVGPTVQDNGLPADEPRDLPALTTSAFISQSIEELKERLSERAYGQIGIIYTLHDSMVTKVEKIDIISVKCGEEE